MLEDTIIACPKCDKEISVKVMTTGKRQTYLVPTDCPYCKESASKIEKALNFTPRKYSVKTEKSYIKLDPRARG